MASLAHWVEGARPRTLPAAVAPVLAGTGAAAAVDEAVWWKALLALVVSLSLQVGVNYANDYSDGVRGTDATRVGPVRLVGSGLAAPATVRTAAYIALGVGALAGLVLAATSAWWLLALGAVAVLAAWGYTGGARPYGYRGLGEVAVFVFFGLVAVLGTTYTQASRVTWPAAVAAIGVGALATAILVANNLRDVPTDASAGKHTLAVLLGAARTRWLFAGLLALAAGCLLALVAATPWVLVGGLFVLPAARALRVVRSGASGLALVPVLRDTGLAELVYATGIALGLGLG